MAVSTLSDALHVACCTKHVRASHGLPAGAARHYMGSASSASCVSHALHAVLAVLPGLK